MTYDVDICEVVDMLEMDPPRGTVQPAPAPFADTPIDGVIARMTDLAERFESEYGVHDGVLCFNCLYLGVTRGVKEAVEEPGYFRDPDTISQLDVRFAELYFSAVAAVDRGEEPPLAWKGLFHSRGKADVLPIQFAVAGMNAHINHDLAIALLEQWEANGERPGGDSAAHADYTKINEILKVEEQRQKAGLEPGLVRELEELDDSRLGRLDDRLALWVVEDAREAAWDTAQHLWAVRHVPLVRKAWMAAVDVTVGALGRALLEPV